MSTVKLTELPLITSLDVNESNTIFVVVDTDSDTTAKITLSTLYSNVNSYLTSNAASANAVINSRITANADSANSVINTRITANVATLRGEITANADSANSVINTRITANAESANSVINTRITANVATLRGEITANADSANSVINTRITANATSTNAFANLAFTKANNAIANTGGVYTAGDFYISGDGFVNGTFTLANKGFIYVPTILEGSQTAFTINFSTSSLIKCDIAADCAITLSNYVHGKVVEVWITNTSGSNRTVTHGCSAVNSTANSTTVTVPATSSAYLRYFSIDDDNANTFVAIQSA